MNEDKAARKLAKLDAMQRHTEERLERQRQAIEARFNRARQKLTDTTSEPTVQQQRIIDAALTLLNEEGLNELSLRKLAAKLHMQAPALYWHFKNKEALIDHMAEAILAMEFAGLQSCGQDETWQAWLTTTCKQLRRAMLSHRDGARIVAGAHLFPAVTLLKLHEVAAESLVSAGVDEEKAELIISTIVHFTFGRVIEEQSSPSPEQIANFDFSALTKEYPFFSRSVDRIQRNKNLVDMSDKEFEDSLRLIIQGC